MLRADAEHIDVGAGHVDARTGGGRDVTLPKRASKAGRV